MEWLAGLLYNPHVQNTAKPVTVHNNTDDISQLEEIGRIQTENKEIFFILSYLFMVTVVTTR